MRKRFLSILLVVAMAAVLAAGCSGGNEAGDSGDGSDVAESDETESKLIGSTLITYDSTFFTDIKAALYDGVKETDELNDFVFEADVEELLQQMEDMVTKEYDCIIFDAFDPEAVYPVMQEAADAGIVLINVDFPSNYPDLCLTTVVSDDYGVGYQDGKELCEYLNGEGQVGCFGDPETATTEALKQRLTGFFDACSEYEGIEIVATPSEGTDATTAEAAMQATLEAHPELDGFFSMREAMTLAAAQAIEASGIDVKIVCCDISESLCDLIRSGRVLCTQDQQAYEMGKACIEAYYDHLDGKEVESKITVPAKTVNIDNVDDYTF